MTITDLETKSVQWYVEAVGQVIRLALPEIRNHLTQSLPNECVGLVWADGSTQRLINQARSEKRFSISLPQLAEKLAEKTDDDILICVYHSHPSGSPSLSWDDKRSVLRQWQNGIRVPWLVLTGSESTLWYPEELNTQTNWRSIPVEEDIPNGN